MKREYTTARNEANARYDAKTYKNLLFKLRVEEDADILQSIEEAKEKGINKREWLRELFEGKK
jgi:DNA-directed RNA polymerase subunit L